MANRDPEPSSLLGSNPTEALSGEWSLAAGTRNARSVLYHKGDVLAGAFEIRSLLGTGAMGQVFEAYDKALGRTVAIKVCWPDINEEILLQEARMMAGFRHEGLTAAHALLRHDGRAILVMERLVGHSLADRLSRDTDEITDLREALDVLTKITDALAVLHKANVVHRDLKPDNIMMVPTDRVVLVDFGIAGMEQFISDGPVAGSLHYIAPETATGTISMGQAHLTDVYALGVIGYELLTGALPFEGDSLPEVLSNQINRPAQSVQLYRPDAPGPLADLIAQMLLPDPSERPSVDIVARRLRAIEVPADTKPVMRRVRALVLTDDAARWSLLAYVVEDRAIEIIVVTELNSAISAMQESSFELVVADASASAMCLELARVAKRHRRETDVLEIGDAIAAASPELVTESIPDLDTDRVARALEKLARRQRVIVRRSSSQRSIE